MRFTERLYKHFERINLKAIPKYTGVFLTLMIACAMFSCENEISKIKTITSTEVLPSITADDYEMLFSDSAVIQFKMQTPLFIRHDIEKDPYTEFPKGVKIEKYDRKMKIVSSITAEYAKNFDSDERWEAKTNVIATNLNGDTLKTEYLVWDTHRQKIYSDQFVKFIRKDKIITGIGFESNQDFTEYKIKNIKGILYVNMDQ